MRMRCRAESAPSASVSENANQQRKTWRLNQQWEYSFDLTDTYASSQLSKKSASPLAIYGKKYTFLDRYSHLQHSDFRALLLHDRRHHRGLVIGSGRIPTPLVGLATMRVPRCNVAAMGHNPMGTYGDGTDGESQSTNQVQKKERRYPMAEKKFLSTVLTWWKHMAGTRPNSLCLWGEFESWLK
jgi:hypothetical protein